MITKGIPSTAWATMIPRCEFAKQPLADKKLPKIIDMALSGATQALAKTKLMPTAMMMIGTIIGEISSAMISRR